MSHSLGGTSLLNSMGVMENSMMNSNLNGGSSTGATSTPSLSPDLAASSSSESCPSPMSHSPNENLNNFSANNNTNNNTLVQSPRINEKHSTRAHSPSNSTSSSISTKSALNSTPTRQFQHDTTIRASVSTNGAGAAGAAPSSPSIKSSHDEDNINSNNNDAGNTSSDDYSDEIKVYNEEGAAEEEQRNEDDLKEEKTEIIKQTIEEKPSPSHPFSINNLMLYNGVAAAAAGKNAPASPFGNNPFAAAAAFGALNQQRQSLFNPAALYSQELASHFAAWWPAAAAGASFNPYSTPPFNPFNALSAAANYQQQAAAAAVFQAAAASRFSPSLFLPPPPGSSGLSSPKAESSSHSASSSASSTSSTSSSSSSSSAFSSNLNTHPSSPFSGSSSSNSSRFNNNGAQNAHASPQHGQFNPNKNSSKKKNYENYPSGAGMPQGMGKHEHGINMHQMNHSNQMGNSQQNHYKQEHLAAPIPHVMVKEKPKKPHVKKPLNAFMLFMKEQRAAVVSECTLRESAAINQILGRKWHELERTEQAKYYEKARLARLEHMQQNPGWSARDNYGLKKKRRRKREKVIGENGELPRKCRARYGLHQLHLWCKPCRRKKKCIRFAGGLEESQNSGGMMNQNGQMFNGVYKGDMGEVGSGGSMNGGNSEDDYDAYEDDSDETDTDDDDENGDSSYQQSPKPNKFPHLMNPHNEAGHLSAPNFNMPTNHSGNLMQNHYQQQVQQQQQQHSQQQQFQQMHNFNLLKQMNSQRAGMLGDMDSKAMLHHQLRLNQESI